MKLTITQNITVDGVVEATDGWFGPAHDGTDTADLTEELQRQMQLEDAFLVGRQTFEDLRGFWPNQTDDTTGITDHLNQVDKYVVSSTLTDPAWEHTTVVTGDPIAAVTELKAEAGGVLGVTGSIQLCHALIAAGLVDEYRLFIHPVVIGRGRRLFPDGTDRVELELVDTTTFRSGITFSTFRPA